VIGKKNGRKKTSVGYGGAVIGMRWDGLWWWAGASGGNRFERSGRSFWYGNEAVQDSIKRDSATRMIGEIKTKKREKKIDDRVQR
jgi:hypothetical protein